MRTCKRAWPQADKFDPPPPTPFFFVLLRCALGGEIQHRWTMNPWIASLFLQCPDNGSWIGKDNGDDSPSSYPLQCPNRTQIDDFKTAVKYGHINFYGSDFCTMYATPSPPHTHTHTHPFIDVATVIACRVNSAWQLCNIPAFFGGQAPQPNVVLIFTPCAAD